MSGDLNRLTIMGRLGGDPELRFLPSGTEFCTFSVATSEQWKDKDTGEKKEKTTWHRCACFGSQAKFAAEYFRKGQRVYVEGPVEHREWEDDNGQRQRITEVKVRDLKFADGKASNGGGGRPNVPDSAYAYAGREQAATGGDIDPDDIPF